MNPYHDEIGRFTDESGAAFKVPAELLTSEAREELAARLEDSLSETLPDEDVPSIQAETRTQLESAIPAPEKPPEPTPEDVAKTQAELDRLYAEAARVKAEGDAVAERIAQQVGGTVAKVPLKGRERTLEKVRLDYASREWPAGDPRRLRDLARNTIVVPEEKFQDTVRLLNQTGVKTKVATPETDWLGFSGGNGTYVSKGGMPMEIQVNTPEMIYAKSDEAGAKAILGSRYDEIARRLQVPAGQGHHYYQQARVLPANDPRLKEIERKSREFYDRVRARARERK